MDIQTEPQKAVVIDHVEAWQMHEACQRFAMFRDKVKVVEVPLPEEGRRVKLGPIRATKIAEALNGEADRLQSNLKAYKDRRTGPRQLSWGPNARALLTEAQAPYELADAEALQRVSSVLGELGLCLSKLGETDQFLPGHPETPQPPQS